MRVLLVGGASLLGQYVAREAVAEGTEVWATHRGAPPALAGTRPVTADLADSASLRSALDAARPDAAILCAALTGVDDCEDHPDEARRANAEGPAALADLCAARGVRLVHMSTDYVFDGEAGPYDEDADPRPVNVYGATKRAGEVEVLRRHPGAAVVRVAALYGWNRVRGKPNSVTWILETLKRGEPVPLFTDQRTSPTYAGDAAPILLALLASDATGIFHVAPPDCVSRFELGALVCEVFGLPRELLKPATLAAAQLRAPRPRQTCLLSRRLPRALNTVRPLRAALEDMRGAA